MTRQISVVINTYNRVRSLERTLLALQALDHPSFEVVVVDGPSTDGTAELLAAWSDRVKVGHCPERNLSMSRNIGIAMAAGELVAFIDDDAYPDPGWLDAVEGAFDDDEVAGAGGPVLDHTGGRLQAHYSLADRTGHAWTSDGPDPSALLANPHGDAFVYPIGTNAVFRRDRLVAIGGFDEEFEYYLDETDVCRRLVDRGWIIRALGRGEVFHKFLASDVRTDQRAIRDRFTVLKNRAYFALKHRGAHYSVADAWHAYWLFANHHQADMQGNIDHGLLTPADLDRLRADIPRAAEVAEAAAARAGDRERPQAWFAEHARAWLAFPTHHPAGRRLHVCFVSAEYGPAQLNGIARVVRTLALELAAQGHVVRVLTQGADHDRVDLEDGVWVHRLVVRPGPAGPARDAWAPSWDFSSTVLDHLDTIDSKRSVDIVQVPNWDAEGLAVLRSGRYRTVMGLYTPLATVAAVDERFGGDVPWLPARLAMEREGYGLASAFLACGPAIVEEIESRYGLEIPRHRLGLVAHGLPEPDVDAEVGSGHPERPDVLFLGRLEPRKGIDTFLACLPDVALQCPTATFTVVGEDRIATARGSTYRQEFERSPWGWLAPDRVRFTGLVDDDERARAYAACDVFVAPSRYESFGLILLEAMMLGKACVAADVGGMAEIVEHGVTGLLVPPGDSAALGEAVASLLLDPARRRAMGEAGRRRFLDHYAAPRMAREVESFYVQLAGSAPAGRVVGASAHGDHPRPVGARPTTVGPPLDLASVTRCPTCAGAARAVDRVRTADGHRKDGTLVCDTCACTLAEVRWFHSDYFAAGRAVPDQGEVRVVPALGERRVRPDAPDVQRLGRWGISGTDAYAHGESGDALVLEATCTDIGVRLLCHPGAGLADLWLDGVLVDTVDLHQDEGSVAVFAPIGENMPFRPHRVEVRPAAGRGLSPHAGTQVLVQELVLLGPAGAEFGPPEPINRGNPYSQRIEEYIATVAPGGRILEVGGGDRRRSQPDMVNFEFLRFELADAYGDLHTLPFADHAFDLVVTQAVFEHLSNPFVAARELVRVTRPGGLIVTEVAFLQPLHAVPYHYFNMTLWGVEELFASCEVVERDWFGSLSETVGWILQSANVPTRIGPERWTAIMDELASADEVVTHADIRPSASGVFLVVRTPAQVLSTTAAS